MKYTRDLVDAGPFQDMMPEGSYMFQRPELPKFKFKVKGVKYEISDLRLLHPTAIEVFDKILEVIADTPNCESVTFDVTDLPDDVLNITDDILGGISYNARKGGKNSFAIGGSLLVTSIEHGRTKGVSTCTYRLIKDNVKIIHEYSKGREQINLPELIIEIVDRHREAWKETLG